MKVACLLALVLALGCGSDDPKTLDENESPATGDGADADGADDVQSCVGELEVQDLAPDAPPKYTCNPSGSTNYPDSDNACRNEDDCALIASDKVRRLAKECALACRGSTDCGEASTCNENCLADATRNQLGGTLTEGCSGCYAQVALCALEKCYAECADDPDSLDCVACSFKQGCRIPFERCSGLDREL
jgi:hypothetical protein